MSVIQEKKTGSVPNLTVNEYSESREPHFNTEIGAISEVEVCKRLSAVNGKVSGWHI